MGGQQNPATVTVTSAPAERAPIPEPERRRFLPGELFGNRYRMIELLGKGGMGEVYSAEDLQLRQTVALKFLPAELVQDESALERLRGEVRMARQIAHPNVCRVYDISETDGEFFVPMEHIDGEDLGSVLRRLGRPTKEKGLEIGRQLCSGLAAAHDNGIVHRDLKPSNVMIDGRGRVRIMDFGLASFETHVRPEERSSGTPAYMGPEQLAGREATVRSDMYALGLVLYEVLTGRRPFTAESVEELRRVRERDKPPRLSSYVDGIDAGVERAVLQCLEPNPAERPASALAVAAAFPADDPLAAAMAAGETPSPELVAAAGQRGALRPAIAAAGLLAVLGGFLLVGALHDRTQLYRRVPFDKPPVVLADRARSVLATLAYASAGADSARGFDIDWNYLGRMEQKERSPERWHKLANQSPAVYRFWYRQSPMALQPLDIHGVVTVNDPPRIISDSAVVMLDSSGRLLWVEVVAPEKDSGAAMNGAANFGPLFASADLDMNQFAPAQPMWNGTTMTDARRAWTGVYPAEPGRALRVEGGLYRGRPVYFRLIDAAYEPRRTAGPDSRSFLEKTSSYLGTAVMLLVMASAALLARHNQQLGRGDRRGAIRLGAAVFILVLLASVLRAHNPLDAAMKAPALAVFYGLLWGIAYLAIEPYVRRLWPKVLISWSRLMAGRWRDPLVGRDVLIGAIAGIAWTAMNDGLAHLLPEAVGAMSLRPWSPDTGTLEGGAAAIAQFFEMDFLWEPVWLLAMYLFFRLLFRKPWLAAACFGLTVMIISAPGNGTLNPEAIAVVPLINLALIIVLMIYVAMRHGLVAFIAMDFFHRRLENFPITLDASAWYAGTSLLVLVALSAVAFYGFRISLAGRRLLDLRNLAG